MSADTIIPDPANPQNLNRYSYVTNNPLRYTDPTGHTVACNPMEDDCHDPDPTPSPAPGNGGNGGGGHHDDDDVPDPNPNGLPAPCSPPGDLVCQIKSDGGYPAGWHEYEFQTTVCSAEWHCTQTEIIYFLSLFAYPGQNPLDGPVESGSTHSVSPFGWFPNGSAVYGEGLILVTISNGGLTTTNRALTSHIFCCGVVERTATNVNGAWVITTHGQGPNVSPAMGTVNQIAGAPLFEGVNSNMKAYIYNQKFPPGPPR